MDFFSLFFIGKFLKKKNNVKDVKAICGVLTQNKLKTSIE